MPVSQTNETALENCIERSLLNNARYEKGTPADFDRTFTIDREKFWRFLTTTQPEELEKLSDRPDWQRLILERLDRKIKKDGILSVLKKGLAIDSAHLTLLYSQPYNTTPPTQKSKKTSIATSSPSLAKSTTPKPKQPSPSTSSSS